MNDALKVNEIIKALNGANPPVVSPVILSGYIASTGSAESTRIVHTLSNLSEWTDVLTTAIVYAVAGKTDLEPWTFFIRPEANVTHHEGSQASKPAREHASFLRGRIMSQYGQPTFGTAPTGIEAAFTGHPCPSRPTTSGTVGCAPGHPPPPPPTLHCTIFCPPPPGPTVHGTVGC